MHLLLVFVLGNHYSDILQGVSCVNYPFLLFSDLINVSIHSSFSVYYFATLTHNLQNEIDIFYWKSSMTGEMIFTLINKHIFNFKWSVENDEHYFYKNKYCKGSFPIKFLVIVNIPLSNYRYQLLHPMFSKEGAGLEPVGRARLIFLYFNLFSPFKKERNRKKSFFF